MDFRDCNRVYVEQKVPEKYLERDGRIVQNQDF